VKPEEAEGDWHMPIIVDAAGANIPVSNGLAGQVKLGDQPFRMRFLEAPIVFESTFTDPATKVAKKSMRFIVQVGLADKSNAPYVGPISLLREVQTQMSLQGKTVPAWDLEGGVWLIVLKRGAGKETRYSVSVGEPCPVRNPDTIAKIADCTKKNIAWATAVESGKSPAPAPTTTMVAATAPVSPAAPAGDENMGW